VDRGQPAGQGRVRPRPQNDLKTARAKANEAQATIADDPFYWYFSASLAIREGDGSRAAAAIGKALTLAPSDPVILFEAGHVADYNGDDDSARSYWMRAAGSDPNGPVGKAAAKAVEMLGVTPAVKTETKPRK
jgi:Flp pilus assembly protein TadD